VAAGVLALLAAGAVLDRAWLAAALLGAAAGALAWRVAADCGRALAAMDQAVGRSERP
jgi:hypothetical protein